MKYNLDKVLMARYTEFLNSYIFKDIPEYSKSEYWKLHAAKVKISLKSDSVEAEGESGFYSPSKWTPYLIIKKLVKLIITNPSYLIFRIKKIIGLPVNGIKHLSYFTAFNKTMKSDPISEPQFILSRINFSSIVKNSFVYKTHKECQLHYDKVSKGANFSDHILIAYYFLNILNSYTSLKSNPKPLILEIGGGNGNLSSVIKFHSKQATIIDIDLPETLSHAILYISNLFPEAKILMPHEAKPGQDLNSYDFVFLTPNQINLIKDESIDLSINIHSFQEMTPIQINEYFELIQRASKNNSYFFTSNRTEKIPSGEEEASFEKISNTEPIRFSEFPWHSSNQVIIYEICRLFRLVQLDSIFNRLEKIKK